VLLPNSPTREAGALPYVTHEHQVENVMAKEHAPGENPVAGSKSPRAGKRPQDQPGAPPTDEEAGETDEETQARESEGAFDRALGRMPPG
jgi:ribosomal protein L12E/L44/L45/RPP1/RPP2